MKIQIKKLHPDAVIPKYQTAGASGFDLHALEDVVLNPGETALIKTGLAISVDPGYELQVRPRSGLSLKTGLRIANSPGTIDSDYIGEVCVIITNTSIAGTPEIRINKNDRIAQGVVCPVIQAKIEVVEELKSSDRGDRGFGSTGL